MKNQLMRLCSLFLVIVMIVNLLPLTVFAEKYQGNEANTETTSTVTEHVPNSSIDYSDTQIIAENNHNRSEFSKEFLMGSGVSMAVVYGSAVHYEKDGKWEEIDNTLKINSNNTITNTAGVWDVRFPQRISGANQIQIAKDGYTLSFGMGGELRNQGNLEVMSQEPTSEIQSEGTESGNSTDNTEPTQEETTAPASTEEQTEATESVEIITDAEALEEGTSDEQETSLDTDSDESQTSRIDTSDEMTLAMSALATMTSEIKTTDIADNTTIVEETESQETTAEETESETTVPETTVPESTVPEETESETTAPEETESQETTAEETETETTVPETTVPESTVPEETETETTTPEETESEETEPETTAPEETEPEATVPKATEPETIAPEETVAANLIPSSPTVSVTIDGVEQTFAISEAKLSQAEIQKIDIKKALDETEYPETVLTKPSSQLMYEEVYTNTDVQYNLIGNQVKESIILQSYDSKLRGYQFTLNTGDLIPVLEDDGHIDLYDPSEETVVMTMPAPYLQDSDVNFCDDIRVILSGSAGTYVLTYMLPMQWLADDERAWPVVLDPIVSASTNINNIQDTSVGSNYSHGYLAGILESGVCLTNGIQRFYVKYGELPELSSADVIVGSIIRLYNPDTSSYYKTVEVHKVTETWESYAVTWEDQPNYELSIEDYVRSKDEGFYYWDVTDIVRGWYVGENTGMMFKASAEAEANTSEISWEQFYSSDFGVDISRPNLFIFFRNNNGLEGYWDYTSSSAGRAGTGHINQYTGNLVWVHDDIGFGGNRMPVSISHIYNTNDKDNTQYGVGAGWRTNFNQRIYKWSEDNSYYIWEDADGTKHYLENESYGVFKDEDGLELTLNSISNNESQYRLTDKNGNISHFDVKGRLIKQVNNQQTKSNILITYTTSSGYAIDTITDGAGRVYDFEYSGEKLSRIVYKGTGSGEISSVSYGYTGTDLTSVQYKDGESTSFTYDSNHLLTSATDIDGYELQYTYNTTTEGQPSRVSSVSELDGSVEGGTLTFEYAHNQTTLTDHNGNTQVLQFNDYGNTVSIQDGEGHAQYAKYAKNDSEETGKGNQLTASSKLQNTVSNLLTDSSFEGGTLWAAASGSRSINSSGYLGSKSMAVTGGRVNSSSFTVAAGERYTFSAYVKTTGDNGVLALYQSGNAVATQSFPASSTWTRVEVHYTNTSSSSKTLTAAVQCGSGQTVYVDCVQVENEPTASRYNLVQNGDFRFSGTPAQGWTKNGFTTGDARITYDRTAAPQLDNNVIQINGDPASEKSVKQDIPVSGNEGDTYVVTGWALANAVPLKEENQPDGETREFGIRLTFHYTDDTTTSKVAQFNTATNTTANWQYSSEAAVAEKAYSSLTVEAVYDYNANTAYFDGIQLYKEEFSQSYAYDEDGNVTSVIDLQKQETKYEYTENNLTKQILPTGAELTYTYDDYHNVLTATTAENVLYKFTYDEYGNNDSVEIVKDGVSIKSYAQYSDDGNYLEYTTDATGKIIEYGYDPDTNVLQWVKYPEDTDATRTNYTYDSMYRMATAAATTDTGLALSAEYTYTDDLLTSIETDSTTYSFGYGDFALRSNVSVGIYTLAEYEYTDEDHYLSTLDYGNESKVQYEYDNQGRVTKQIYKEESENSVVELSTVEYRYDNNGALATVTDSATGRTTTYYYDFIDRMMKYVESGEGYSHSVGYEYDTINNLTKLVETINGTTYSTNYTYDNDNRVTNISSGNAKRNYTYDGFGRVSQQVTKYNSTTVKTDSYSFKAPSGETTSSQVTSHSIDTTNYDKTFQYTYDDNGNILSVSDGSKTTSYVYDSANQLVRENNQAGGFTHTWTYDSAGNILNRKEYAYTTGTLGAPTDTFTYSYDDASWGDLLTTYDGQRFDYDDIGNLVDDGPWEYTWQHGRQLASMSNGVKTWNFTYNADGLRTKRSDGTNTYEYVYNGDKLSHMTINNSGTIRTLRFTYDAAGTPLSLVLTLNGSSSIYYYVTNIQGDVVALLNSAGKMVVEYSYDAWGNLLSIDGEFKNGLGIRNPLRYRSYVYDSEYGYYYLQSRYYNPETGRFLNADAFTATGQGLLGNNMFSYCQNCPIVFSDDSGYRVVRRSAEMVGGGTPYIIDQTDDPIGQEFLGSSTVAHGGCGVVATYNALVDLGASTDFEDVLAYYNEKPVTRLTLNGWLGILPPVVAQYFTEQGYEVIMTDSWDAIDIHSQTADASIMYYMFQTNNTALGFGAHYISYRGIDNKYIGMNTSTISGTEYFTYPSDYGYRDKRFYALGIFIYN